MNTKDLVIVATMSALSIVLSLFAIFKLPMGGSVSLYLVPVILLALKKDLKTSLLGAFIVVILQIVTGSYVIGIPQVVLDYVLPVFLISTISIVRNKELVYQIGYLTLVSVLALLSYTISGILYFGTPFVPSLTYNVSHFVPTIIICSLIVYMIKGRIKM